MVGFLTDWITFDRDGNETDGAVCAHIAQARTWPDPPPYECEDCLREGTQWVHLRQCLICGGVRCCDNSPRRHASAHGLTAAHPLVRSAEPEEVWVWCYPEEYLLAPAEEVAEEDDAAEQA